LYNHYRDKDSVIRALCESQLAQLVGVAQAAPDVTSALEQVSILVSKDSALAAMRAQDPDLLTIALSAQHDTLWTAFSIALSNLLGLEKSELAIRWLIGQVLHPINPAQSRSQAESIAGFENL
jgi:AcrR family transcriptional regulator